MHSTTSHLVRAPKSVHFPCRPPSFLSHERALNHDALNLTRAFIDAGHPYVAQIALDGKLTCVAIPAVELHRSVADAVRGFGRVDLAHRSFAAERSAFVFE